MKYFTEKDVNELIYKLAIDPNPHRDHDYFNYKHEKRGYYTVRNLKLAGQVGIEKYHVFVNKP